MGTRSPAVKFQPRAAPSSPVPAGRRRRGSGARRRAGGGREGRAPGLRSGGARAAPQLRPAPPALSPRTRLAALRPGTRRRGGPGRGDAAAEPLEPRQALGPRRAVLPRRLARGGAARSPAPSPSQPFALPDPSRALLPFPLSPGETWPGAARRRQTTGEASW